jgi:diaminohydroxyphosphoribosylaminopyrimidine deaminase/5-amino-6-(5-phosphoribosylamino)uracil reductase
MNHDLKFIKLALNLASKNIGNTAENPSVGCVITKNNIILSTAITSENGRPHAEINAINKIKDKSILAECTIYITLEPCCHFGKSPPCVDEIIKYNFARVVICMKDPDLRVNGNGIKKLQIAGINTEIGLLENEAYEINRDFFYGKKYNKPFITLKLATSLDGKIATQNLESKWISSDKSRKYMNNLRSKYSGIMVGANTIKMDNPTLNCRINGLEEYSPIPIIISSKLDFTFNEKVFNQEKSTILICPKSQINHENLNKWLKKSTLNQVIFIENTHIIADRININYSLEKLYQIGINSILVEGGSVLATQMLKDKLINELIWIHAPIILGSDSISAINSLNILGLNDEFRNFKLISSNIIDNDIISIYSNKI